MKSANESVALQAVEFWSTVCEEEVEITLEMQDVSAHFLSSVIFRSDSLL